MYYSTCCSEKYLECNVGQLQGRGAASWPLRLSTRLLLVCPFKSTANATADKGVAIQQQRIKEGRSQFVKILGFLNTCDHFSDMHRY
jgi:hypothetical protein